MQWPLSSAPSALTRSASTLACNASTNTHCPCPLLPRFTDVKQLFYEAQREALERRGGKGGAGVQMPDIVELQTNYRTHS